jgi:hypothetical protein
MQVHHHRLQQLLGRSKVQLRSALMQQLQCLDCRPVS